jgi:hypothetical protein
VPCSRKLSVMDSTRLQLWWSVKTVLMLFERTKNGRILLVLPTLAWKGCIWSCSRRRPGGETTLAARQKYPSASVAWQATTKEAVFQYGICHIPWRCVSTAWGRARFATWRYVNKSQWSSNRSVGAAESALHHQLPEAVPSSAQVRNSRTCGLYDQPPSDSWTGEGATDTGSYRLFSVTRFSVDAFVCEDIQMKQYSNPSHY